MRLLYHSLALYLSLTPNLAGAKSSSGGDGDGDATVPLEPCTVRSAVSGAFFDINPLHIPHPDDVPKTKTKHPRPNSWNTTGWDYGYNFTMNFCGGVIEDLGAKGGVVGVEEKSWRNVSAYYEKGEKVFSLGMESRLPVLRGRKLVLNYTDGSPCGGDVEGKREHKVEDLSGRALIDDGDKKDDKKKGDHKGDDDDDDDDEDDEDDKGKSKGKGKGKATTDGKQRKSTIVSLLCDRDPLAPQLTLSFVGASPDECAYFFEARSPYACAGVEEAKQTLSPGGVFGVIVTIAIIVYLVGGCVYSRVVLNQRGWKQLPNYHMWAGIAEFFKDLFIICFSSCSRFLPSRRGYNRLNGNMSGSGGGRGNSRWRSESEAENRLIDELNEEWED
ncbi:mannose 6-phosphate receptor domain-containing protein [Polychaeton citri CBS 116435]|uniref:Mannose 6-phosphate receptor domain-containing protein n=1 Tax=Polychaeton citri CBS 116435 TaxID=1314669 RepID=A0A9P4QBB5_9PEZI|nr:mannose 6-phosphate receptor domain-containing protein [Polychaeton citri CBS 116435]